MYTLYTCLPACLPAWTSCPPIHHPPYVQVLLTHCTGYLLYLFTNLSTYLFTSLSSLTVYLHHHIQLVSLHINKRFHLCASLSFRSLYTPIFRLACLLPLALDHLPAFLYFSEWILNARCSLENPGLWRVCERWKVMSDTARYAQDMPKHKCVWRNIRHNIIRGKMDDSSVLEGCPFVFIKYRGQRLTLAYGSWTEKGWGEEAYDVSVMRSITQLRGDRKEIVIHVLRPHKSPHGKKMKI